MDYEKLASRESGEPSARIRTRVEAARHIQRLRFGSKTARQNGTMGPAQIREYCQLGDTAAALMRSAMQQLNLSARAYHRVLKLARTIADLAEAEQIGPAHLAEAIQYRRREVV